MTMKLTSLLVFGLSLLQTTSLFPDVVVNEIMSNVPGAESGPGSPGDRMEFIELYNCSVTESADLSGWSFSDGDVLDQILAWEWGAGDTIGSSTVEHGTTLLRPGRFALILDPEYFRPGEGGWYSIGDSTLVLTVGNTTLGDGLSSKDPVVLIDSGGDTVSTFGTPGWDDGFPEDPGDGISWERVDPTAGDHIPNWATSTSQSGSTPGSRNSHSIPVNLSVLDSSLNIDPREPEEGETVEVTGTVVNKGVLDTPEFEVWFLLDRDKDGSLEEEEVETIKVVFEPIMPGDSLDVMGKIGMGGRGFYLVGMAAVHADDGDVTDNLQSREVKVGNTEVRVVINEIFYDPADGGREWVEIFNRSDATLDLSGWTFSDDKARGFVKGDRVLFGSGSYAILTGDSTALVERLPELLDRQVVEVRPYPSLNNDGDAIMLETAGGYLSDRIEYSPMWGGGKGVSLERVNPIDPASGPSRWGSSVDPGGSTPGRENSIYQAVGKIESSFQVRPKIFSPNGDGCDDRALLSYRLSVPKARVRLEIYDLLGNRVKVVLDQVESGSEGTGVWDGRNESGRLLPVGIYVAYMEAIDPFGGYLENMKRAVVLGGEL